MAATLKARPSYWLWAFVAMILALLLAVSPAVAHKDHEKAAEASQVMQHNAADGAPMVMDGNAAAMHSEDGTMSGDMDMHDASPPVGFFERLVGWFGRLHPLFVHFPVAFFPAALVAAIIGRRRPSFDPVVRFLVVAGGIFAPVAAVAGWLAGLGADPEPILTYHRWLGVVVGLSGAGLGLWAWRGRTVERRSGMIVALSVMTLVIGIQGFLGAAVTHGLDHLMF